MPPKAMSSQPSEASPTSGTSSRAGNNAGAQTVEKDLVGFGNWQSSTKLASSGGGKISEQEAQWNIKENKFGQTVEVYQKECFTLKPLTITEGPYKGCNVLVLVPVENKDYFRFLDPLPELRTMVYEYSFAPESIAMSSHKVTHERKRPVVSTFHRTTGTHHEGMVFDKAHGKWNGQVPSSFSLLRVSKQLLQETAPVAYKNTFSFDLMRDATLFLQTIGNMKEHLTTLTLGRYSYQKTRARSFFTPLADAKQLRSIHLPHDLLCNKFSKYGRVSCMSLEQIVEAARPTLMKMHKARKDSESAVPVLDLIKIDPPENCHVCRGWGFGPGFPKTNSVCATLGCCNSPCVEAETHNAELIAKLHCQLATVLGIKEDE
ncbi:hypothetical protein LTR27_002465 [Elasticomyces elasticus]|nr:hypothetical protein LTR27_002465 [Elasticomyces elasticus]